MAVVGVEPTSQRYSALYYWRIPCKKYHGFTIITMVKPCLYHPNHGFTMVFQWIELSPMVLQSKQWKNDDKIMVLLWLKNHGTTPMVNPWFYRGFKTIIIKPSLNDNFTMV